MSLHLRDILVVDDDANDVELMLLSLNSLKLANTITVVRDGVEGLTIFTGEAASQTARASIPCSCCSTSTCRAWAASTCCWKCAATTACGRCRSSS